MACVWQQARVQVSRGNTFLQKISQHQTAQPQTAPHTHTTHPHTQLTPAHSTPLPTTPAVHQPNSPFHTKSVLAKPQTDLSYLCYKNALQRVPKRGNSKIYKRCFANFRTMKLVPWISLITCNWKVSTGRTMVFPASLLSETLNPSWVTPPPSSRT